MKLYKSFEWLSKEGVKQTPFFVYKENCSEAEFKEIKKREAKQTSKLNNYFKLK